MQYNNLNFSSINNSFHVRDLENYDKIVLYTQSLISDKINNIKLHSINNRKKRGLINGLGTLIKTITGNLDATDGEKISKILRHIQGNEHNLANQLKVQYSINSKLVENFNKTVQDIQHNEIVLKSRILQLNTILKAEFNQQDILFAKDLYNQLFILYNAILNIL